MDSLQEKDLIYNKPVRWNQDSHYSFDARSEKKKKKASVLDAFMTQKWFL